MDWTVFIGPWPAVVQEVTLNSSDYYQLIGSSFIISNFTPFIVRLTCKLKVMYTEDFQLLSAETRDINFYPITILESC